jgi:hypothetical protein
MYIEYIIYNFLTTIGPHVFDSWNIIKEKEIEKLMQWPSIKSPPFLYRTGFKKKNCPQNGHQMVGINSTQNCSLPI